MPRSELIVATCVFAVFLILYCGPFFLQSILNRRPASEDVRAAILAKAPRDLRVGDWREVESIDLRYSRKHPTDWTEDLVASGEWQVEATLKLRQKADLFRREDFAARARASGDNSADFEVVAAVAARLSSRSGLPGIPAAPPLYTRASSAGDESTANVELDVQRFSYCWLGLSPISALRCWGSFFSEKRGWSVVSSALPTIAAPTSSDGLQLCTREEFPGGAVVMGEPSFEKVVADYRAARATYVTAVKKEFGQEKLVALDNVIRAEAGRLVAATFYPENGWRIDSIDSVSAPRPSEGGVVEAVVPVVMSRTQALYALAASDEAARLMAVTERFQAARKTAEELLLPLTSSWPKAPTLYAVSKSRGEVIRSTMHVRAHDAGGAWALDSLAFDDSEVPKKNVSVGLTAAEIGAEAAFIDNDAPGLSSPRDWLRQQDELASAVEAEEKRISDKYGSDRAAWRLLSKIFAAAGGGERLKSVGSFTEEVKTQMPWPWLLGKRDAQGSGTIRRVARPFRVDETLSVSFRFKPLLAAEYAVEFTSVGTTTEENRYQETKDCYLVTAEGGQRMNGNKGFDQPPVHRYYLNREYSSQLVWHLAVDDGPFAVRMGDGPTHLLVKPTGYPEFQVDVDDSGNIQKIAYTDSTGDGKYFPVVWRFSDYRNFSGINLPTKREVWADGKRDWAYEVTGVQFASSLAAGEPTGRRPQVPDENRIETDLIGYSIGRGYQTWRFDSVSEFREFTVLARGGDESSVTYRVHVSLMGSNNIAATADLAIKYSLRNGKWVLDGLDDQGSYRQRY